MISESTPKWDFTVNDCGDVHRCYILFNGGENIVYFSNLNYGGEKIVTKVILKYLLFDNKKLRSLSPRLKKILGLNKRILELDRRSFKDTLLFHLRVWFTKYLS